MDKPVRTDSGGQPPPSPAAYQPTLNVGPPEELFGGRDDGDKQRGHQPPGRAHAEAVAGLNLRRTCRKRGSASFDLVISGRTGRVTKIKTAQTVPRCVRRAIMGARFGRFKAATIDVIFPAEW